VIVGETEHPQGNELEEVHNAQSVQREESNNNTHRTLGRDRSKGLEGRKATSADDTEGSLGPGTSENAKGNNERADAPRSEKGDCRGLARRRTARVRLS
jgi:hypothetical protein